MKRINFYHLHETNSESDGNSSPGKSEEKIPEAEIEEMDQEADEPKKDSKK